MVNKPNPLFLPVERGDDLVSQVSPLPTRDWLARLGMIYDVTVLGAGVEGSSTAYYLTKKAGVKRVLLLEQVSTHDSSVYSCDHTRPHTHMAWKKHVGIGCGVLSKCLAF